MRLRQISKTMRAGTSEHFVEIAGRIECLKFVVQQIRIPVTQGVGPRFGQYSGQHAVGLGHLLQEIDHAPRVAHLLLRGLAGAAGEQHGIAQDLLDFQPGYTL